MILLQALALFLLYIRCSAIDPADPGILLNFGHKSVSTKEKKQEFSSSTLMLNTDQGVKQSPALSSGGSSFVVQSRNIPLMFTLKGSGDIFSFHGKPRQLMDVTDVNRILAINIQLMDMQSTNKESHTLYKLSFSAKHWQVF